MLRIQKSSILIVLAIVTIIYINCNYLKSHQADKIEKIRERLSISNFGLRNNKNQELSKLSEDLDEKLRFSPDSSLDEQIAKKAVQLQDRNSVRIQKNSRKSTHKKRLRRRKSSFGLRRKK